MPVYAYLLNLYDSGLKDPWPFERPHYGYKKIFKMPSLGRKWL
jgi:hypothetical protein